MFDSSKVKREDFANLFSYKAALWGGEMCNKILKLKEQGFQFFYEDSIFNCDFNFKYGEDFLIGWKTSENCTEVWCGCTHAEVAGEWKVWCSKKELTEIFKRIRFVSPKEFKSLI